MAIEGKFDFIRRTNPWRSEKDDQGDLSPDTPENVAKKFQAWAMAMQGRKPERNRQRGQREGVVLPPGMEMPTPPEEKG